VSDDPDRFARQAEGWSEEQYADVGAYLTHRAELIRDLGPALPAGALVLDLACGDGGLGEALLALGLRYHGVDLEPAMVRVARERLGERATVDQGDLDRFTPPGPVDATTLFRALYYAADRRSLFERVRSFSTRKLVFDLNPRQYPVSEVVEDLRAAGWSNVALHPFFVPQTVRLPSFVAVSLRAAERTGPLARLALRFRFTYLVAASPASGLDEG
jgi:SAM-dependent methyltransferase